MTARLAAAILLVPVALTGCGAFPVQTPSTSTGASKLARAEATHEYPSPRPATEHATGAQSAIRAINAFANAYINWNARTVVADMRALAGASVDQARSAMQLAAVSTARDYELARGGIANSGTVEAIAPLIGSRNRYVVVTRESTRATNDTSYQGLRPAWHLTVATVITLAPGRWVLSGWQPEN